MNFRLILLTIFQDFARIRRNERWISIEDKDCVTFISILLVQNCRNYRILHQLEQKVIYP